MAVLELESSSDFEGELLAQEGIDEPILDLTLDEVRELKYTLTDKEVRIANLKALSYVLGREIDIQTIDMSKVNTGLIFSIAQRKYKEIEPHGEDI